MFELEVSGIQKKSNRKTGPASQSISHNDQRQSFAGTLNPEIIGPRAGPQVAAATQKVKRYGSLSSEYMSPMVAPPVANAGLPK